MKNGLSLRIISDKHYHSIESCLNLADFYKNTNSKQATIYAIKACKTAILCPSIDDISEELQFLMSNNREKEINPYPFQFIRLNNSIKKVSNNTENHFAKVKYKARKSNLENIQIKLLSAEILLLFETAKIKITCSILLQRLYLKEF